MSGQPNDDQTDETQGSQSTGGQHQGGQPQGGQPQAAQPQGAQPQGGQPQGAAGQYQQGQAAGAATPGVGDILNRADTQHEIKVGIALFAVVGLGMGLNMFLADALGPDNSLGSAVLGVSGVATLGPVMVAPLLSAIVAIRVGDNLPDLPEQPLFATAGLIGFAGTFVVGIITWFFGTITFDNFFEVGDLFGPWIGAGIGSAVAAVVVLVALKNI